MLTLLQGKARDRKGTLYFCGGCRAIWPLLYHHASRQLVEVAERFADGQASREEYEYAAWAAEVPTFGFDVNGTWREGSEAGVIPDDIRRLIALGVLSEE